MIKNIKRAGIIFLAVAIICLMAIGCLSVNSVTSNGSNVGILSSEKSNSSSGDINSNGDSTIYKNGKDNAVPSAEKEYTLTCDCPNGEPCVCGDLAKIWNEAQQYSIDNGVNVKITLGKDWIAKELGDSTTFGEGYFNNGSISVIVGSHLTLDLNGHTIDRKLTKAISNGSVFNIVGGTFNLCDSNYDAIAIEECYNQYKSYKGDKTTLITKLNELSVGKITGGQNTENGGGLFIDGTLGGEPKVNIYGGLILRNKAKSGAGIYANDSGSNKTNINIYQSSILLNNSTASGCALYLDGVTASLLNLFVAANSTVDQAAIIYIIEVENCVIEDCKILDNETPNVGGGAVRISESNVDIYSCEIAGHINDKSEHGAAMGIESNSIVNIYDIDIHDNKGRYGSIFLYAGGTLNFYDGKIYNNSLETSGGIDCSRGYLNIYGGEFYNNYASSWGSFSYTLNYSVVNLYGGYIHDNTSAKAGGCFVVDSTNCQLNIGAGIKFDNNSNDNGDYDLNIKNGHKIGILERLFSADKSAKIKVAFEGNYGDNSFTTGYSRFNSDLNPNMFFFSSNTDYAMKLLNGEVALDKTATKPTNIITWTYGTGANENTTQSTLTLPYKGSDYTIKSSIGSFTMYGEDSATSYNIKDVGTYTFHMPISSATTAVGYINPTIAITISPKEVDLEWNNVLTYNGLAQTPTATIKNGGLIGGDTCSVSVIGSATNVGTGYYATANSISNSNYVISSSTKNSYFEIVPKTLNVTIKTNNKSVYFNGNKVDLKNEWFTITHDAVGVDSAKNINSLFKIDYNAFMPQFHNGTELLDSAMNVGEYTIHSTQLNIAEVFTGNRNYNVNVIYENTGKLTINTPAVVRASAESGYDFMILQNNKRVLYKEKELIHGDNDSEYTNFVLGNIAPNTSVQTLLNNLVFSDMSQVQIYNGANEVVYGENAKTFYTANIDNGTELAVGTGWYIRYTTLNDEEETIYLSVLGDLTGDGKVNSADVNRLRQMVNNSEVYANSSEVVKLSSLIINNGKTPNNADAEILWNVVCGKIDIADFI